MPDVKKKLLHYYKMNEGDYAFVSSSPSFDDLPKIPVNEEVMKAKIRLEIAAKKNEKTLIYGDYDADGIMSSSIMRMCLREKGLEADVFIPSRYSDGYGLTMENVIRIADKFSLVILVDNGINAVEEIAYLAERNVDVIVFDHHEVGPTLPPAFSLVHPDLLSYGPYAISAGYLCFAFSRYFLERDDDYLAALAGISTISDCMPVAGYNLKLIALTLRFIVRDNMVQISDLTSRRHIDERVLGMDIIPQINSIGRMEKRHMANKIVDYFSKEDRGIDFQRAMVDYLKGTNAKRKEVTKEAEKKFAVNPDAAGIALLGDQMEGLNGLLANKILNEYDKPTLVFSPSEADPSTLVGSARSKQGFDVVDFWSSSSDLILRSGGHPFAGGVTIRKEDFPTFRDRFLAYAAAHPFEKERPPHVNLSLDEVTPELYRLIRSFGPFGQQRGEPLFWINEIPAEMLRFTPSGKCMRTLWNGVELFSFTMGRKELPLQCKRLGLEGHFHLNEYGGNTTVRFECSPVFKH